MLFRSGKRKRSRKKYKRRKRGYRLSRRMGVAAGMPSQTRYVNLRWVYRSAIQSTGPTLASTYIAANSARNPSTIPSVLPMPPGSQPLHFDNLAALYERVMVVGSKATWFLTPLMPDGNTSAPNTQMMVGAYVSKQVLPAFDEVTDYISHKRGQYKAMTIQRNQTTVTSKYSCKKFFNITNPKDNNADFAEDTLRNGKPFRGAYHILYCQNIGVFDSRVTSLPFICTLDMTCVFSTPRDTQDS